MAQFRDRVLVPAFNQVAPDPTKPHPKTETAAVEDLVGLLALVPEPPATDAAATAAWKKLVADLEHGAEHLGRTYNARRAASARERANPPPMIRKVNFCGAAALPDTDRRDETLSQATAPAAQRTLLDMNGYQWTVLFAAWLGWGFDCFDGLLFNYVAPNCVPTLLGLTDRLARWRARRRSSGAASSRRCCWSAGRRAGSSSGRSPIASAARAR